MLEHHALFVLPPLQIVIVAHKRLLLQPAHHALLDINPIIQDRLAFLVHHLFHNVQLALHLLCAQYVIQVMD
jgi:hypothetical protein